MFFAILENKKPNPLGRVCTTRGPSVRDIVSGLAHLLPSKAFLQAECAPFFPFAHALGAGNLSAFFCPPYFLHFRQDPPVEQENTVSPFDATLPHLQHTAFDVVASSANGSSSTGPSAPSSSTALSIAISPDAPSSCHSSSSHCSPSSG